MRALTCAREARDHHRAVTVRVRELRLRDFRSFEDVRLPLDGMTFLVGRNGSGKSTLLDALAFLRESFEDTLPTALDRRGGLHGLRRRGSASGTLQVALRFDYLIEEHGGGLDFDAHPWADQRTLVTDARFERHHIVRRALYGFEVGSKNGRGAHEVRRERFITDDPFGWCFRRDGASASLGRLDHPAMLSMLASDRLALPALLATHEAALHPLQKALTALRPHDPDARQIGLRQEIGADEWIARDGRNVGDILHRLAQNEADRDRAWIVRHLGAIVPGIEDVEGASEDGRRVIEFAQRFGESQVERFPASAMSVGTLRTLSILAALRPREPALVAVDEVEGSIHTAALGVLLEAAALSADGADRVDSGASQVLLATHSTDALTTPQALAARVRVVELRAGKAEVFQLSEGARAAAAPPGSVGDLLRINALWPGDEPLVNSGDLLALS